MIDEILAQLRKEKGPKPFKGKSIDTVLKKHKKKVSKKHKKIIEKPKVPLIVVPKDMSENMDSDKVKDWLATLPGYIEGLTSLNGAPVKLYDYQTAFMKDGSKFRTCKKARQIGISLGIAAECMAKSQLCKINTSIIISYNKDEASEKINYCRALFDTIPLEYRKKRVTDNKQSQIFKDSLGNMTRIISTAQRPPRGKGYNTDVYLDEAAFYQWLERIYVASVPVISRGTGVLTLVSTPYGAKGKFWEIAEHPESYPEFSRHSVPWWYCPDLCSDIFGAYKYAKNMCTEERVMKYGKIILPSIFKSMPLDDFQQEYELAYVDENVSYFPIETTKACVYRIENDDSDYAEIEDFKKSKVTIEKSSKTPLELKHAKIKFYLCKSIEELSYKINSGEINSVLFAGFDVGRKKDKSELYVVEELDIGEARTLHIVRFALQFDRKKFEEQKSFVRHMLINIPINKLAIDSAGIGMDMAESLETEFSDRIESIYMTTEWKDRAAQSLKLRFESQHIAIPDDVNLLKQISSIKKKVSDTGFVRYDAEKDKDHHGDKLWALAMASSCGADAFRANLSSGILAIDGRRLSSNKVNKELSYERSPILNIGNDQIQSDIIDIPRPITDLLNPGRFVGDSQWSNNSIGSPMLARTKY